MNWGKHCLLNSIKNNDKIPNFRIFKRILEIIKTTFSKVIYFSFKVTLHDTTKKQKTLTFLSAVILIPVGLYTKFYSGIGAVWVHNSLGGLVYVVFWCLVFYFLFPYTKIILITAGVLFVTCCLEFMQLWEPAFLTAIRSTFTGRAMIGNSFNWSDFPYYFLGAFTGFFWIRLIRRLSLK